jgi:hypothetical protein
MKKHNGNPNKPAFDAEGYQVNIQDLNGEALPDPARLQFKPFKHGGARSGAGRKPVGRKPVLLRLSPTVIATLRAKAKAEHKTLSAVAEERLVLA